MLKSKKQIIMFVLATALVILPLIVPVSAHAAGLVPCGSNGEKPCTVLDIFYLIARVTNWLLSIVGIYAVFQIVFAGFNLVISMGNEESITKNKKMVSNAVVGFVFALLSYILMNTAINGVLLNNTNCKEKRVDLSNPWTYVTLDPKGCMK